MPIKYYLSLTSLLVAPLVQACGPWLPESYLLRNDDVFYAPPKVGFAAELEYLLPESVPHQAVLDGEEAGGPTSVQELREALKADGVEQGASEQVIAGYKEFRNALREAKPYLSQQSSTDQPYMEAEERDANIAAAEALQVPEKLPQEFRLYLKGALAYYRDELDDARAHWQVLLELPKEQRQYRSVMAAFMLAKTCPEADHSSAFERVRALAGDGFADSLGLAAASYGRQAQINLKQGAFLPAIELYLYQWASGYGNAVRSLEVTADRAWTSANANRFTELVEDEKARAVLIAYLLTHHEDKNTSHHRQQLLEALPDVKNLELMEAGRFALAEYQRNNLSAARLWLNYAEADDALALWVRSKLLLRAGKIDEGRTLMLALTESFKDKEPDWRRLDTKRAWCELGLLYLREERYGEAADAFWNAQSWRDCAYVMERLLRTEELLEWLATHPEISDDTVDGESARALTARRLMREARFEEALGLFSREVRVHAEDYIRSMKAAHDSENEAVVRARHFWTAARIMRDNGMQLFGSELAPDYVWVGGLYDWGDLSEIRAQVGRTVDYRINRFTREESDRVNATRIEPNKRFHYRYRAVRLAELAAGLLPNNDEDASRIYVVSASWIQKRDPLAADRLFKQLAVRCADTELGRAALAKNWFPAVDLSAYQPFVGAEFAD